MSLHYPFPVIRTIDDVLPHIDDNFRVVEKEGLTFINYNFMGPEVFPHIHRPEVVNILTDHAAHRAAVRRECRGIVFDTASGAIVSRPFHKFFNAGEREDVSLDKIDVTRPHLLVEKLDGSMIRPLHIGGGFRWGTKMGVTDVGMLAEEFVAGATAAGDDGYIRLAEACHDEGLTPLFEFCSRRSRVVVDYPVETMVLLAIRNTVSGAYLPRWQVRSLAGAFGVPVVENVDVAARQRPEEDHFVEAVSDLGAVMGGIRDADEGEGKILLFEDGHAVKIKSDWYVRVHRAKDMMRSEMRLLALFFNDELDDLMATIGDEDRRRIEAYLSSFNEALGLLHDSIFAQYNQVRGTYETKKDFALSGKLSPPWRSLVFRLWDAKHPDAYEAARLVVINAMTSETRFAQMKADFHLETGWDDVWANDMEDAA
ncbi:hypothetical protein [Phaeobacter phage MD18]|nr:hypothetical protein [Phaeobacter phage MD18]